MENNLVSIEITREELKMMITALDYYHLQQLRNKMIYGPSARNDRAINTTDTKILQLRDYLQRI